MIDGVLSGCLSMALVDGPLHHPDLDGVEVFSEEMLLITASSHAPVTRAQDINGKTVYGFRSNCSYRRHFEEWFKDDQTMPGKIFEMESYHGILACVTAGAGVALVPRSMPGSRNVNAYPLNEAYRYRNIWRHGARSANLSAFIDMIQPYRIMQSA